jgi:hypothetical protein
VSQAALKRKVKSVSVHANVERRKNKEGDSPVKNYSTTTYYHQVSIFFVQIFDYPFYFLFIKRGMNK